MLHARIVFKKRPTLGGKTDALRRVPKRIYHKGDGVHEEEKLKEMFLAITMLSQSPQRMLVF